MITTRATKRTLSSAAVLLLLSGCADFDDARHKEQEVAHMGTLTAPPAPPTVTTVSDPYLIGEPIKDTDSTPEILRASAGIMIPRPVSLRDAAIIASRITHIPVTIAPDAEAPASAGMDGSALSQPIRMGAATLPAPPSLTGFAGTRSSWSAPGPWLHYSGTRAGVFDAIATRLGVWDRWKDGHIEFYRTETRTFVVPAFNGTNTNNSSITAITGGGSNGGSSGMGGMGGGSMSGGGAGGMSQGSGSGSSSGMTTFSRKSVVDPWESLEKTAQTIAGGGTVAADKNLGILTISGTPDQVARVSEWLKGLSDSLMQQVAIDVHVYTLKVTHETNYGWSPQIALKNYGKVYGLSAIPAAIPSMSTTDVPFSFGASILNSATGASGQFSGSQLAVQALAQLGNVAEIYSREAVSTNGVAAPFQNGINTTYLESSNSVLASNAGSSASLTPGVVMSGFMGEVTPKIINRQILLHINFLLQTLLSITSFSSNGSTIQEPKTSSTALDDTVVLKSGSTLMLSGYVDDASSRSRNGVGSPLMWLLGGGGDSQLQKTQVIVTVEAHTLSIEP
ncbi:pilus assembly protein PilN [Gluconacetobacter diazotrophicus]|uniref:Pilus assembly protein PilN n=1 Tax=Gluconacetobacter diazotrophicus TaxID=33996 RepID=A0A7W4FF63_GLUDI|nr:pilus assembly protein PilN [Gluconacetobacter diazotrophicus]MBB2156625.1 pilus assembly protein PilN [Gluconacetobacter diazotrophicus]